MADQEDSGSDETEVPPPQRGVTSSVTPVPVPRIDVEISRIQNANGHADEDVSSHLNSASSADNTSIGAGHDLSNDVPEEEQIPSTVTSARSYNSHGYRAGNDDNVRTVVSNQIDENELQKADDENSRPNPRSANACSRRSSRSFDEEAAEPASAAAAQSNGRAKHTRSSLAHITSVAFKSEFDDISSSSGILIQPNPLNSSFNGSSGGLYASSHDTYDSHHHGIHISGRESVSSQVEEEIPEILEDASDAEDAIAVIEDLRDLVENSQDDFNSLSPSALVNVVPNLESNESQFNNPLETTNDTLSGTSSRTVDNGASQSNVVGSNISQTVERNLGDNVLVTGSSLLLSNSEEISRTRDISSSPLISSITNANITPLLLVSSSGDTPTTDDQYLSSEELADRVSDSPNLDGFRTVSRIYTSAQRFRRRLSEPNRVSAIPTGNQLTTGDSYEMDIHPNLANRRQTRSLSSAVSHISVHPAEYSDLARLHSASVSSVLLSEATSRPSTSRLPPPYDEYFTGASTSPRSSDYQARGSSPPERPPSSGHGHRPTTQSRPNTAARHPRPSSTLNNRPRSTGMCRGRSARFSWPATKWENIDVVHLPPTGPDCLPGCGYSGLPCYICSAKGFEDPDKLLELDNQHRSLVNFPIWTIFRNRQARPPRVDPFPAPVHLPLRQGGPHPNYQGPPPTYRSLFPTAALTDCWQKFRQKLGIPRACSTQCIVIMVIVYAFLIVHLLWTTF